VIRNETEVLNLKTRKTQVPMGYLTLNFKILISNFFFFWRNQTWQSTCP
jgi:hypothetical protein